MRYIFNETKRFHTFVGNRISVIHDGSNTSQWRYIDSNSNPGDDASRGLSVEGLLGSNHWIHGPDFLWKNEDEWLKSLIVEEVPDDDVEVKRSTLWFHENEAN